MPHGKEPSYYNTAVLTTALEKCTHQMIPKPIIYLINSRLPESFAAIT